MIGRNRVAIVVAEFLGTGILALVMLSVQHSTIGLPYFISLAAGLTLVVATIVFGRVGGGHFNPAITIGMWTARQIKALPALGYIIAQMLGAWAAYYLYTYFVKQNLPVIGGHYDSHVLVAEAVGGFIVSMGFAAAVFHRFLSNKAAGTVGAAYAIAIIVGAGVITTSGNGIGIINPAVALSMRAYAGFGGWMGWGTYALGPVLGAIIGFNLYALLFSPENPPERIPGLRSGRAASATAPVLVVEEEIIAEDDDTEQTSTSSKASKSSKSNKKK